MDKWNEIRTAYKLAKLGTLSATAEDMGVHRSTITRHIDILEENLGIKLFQRNDKGYIPTQAGLEVMRLGEVTETHFSQLSSQLSHDGHNLEGSLRITCIGEMVSMVMPSVKTYQSLYPRMHVEIIGDLRNFKLEYGEADIAIRAGKKPVTLDNVVWPFLQATMVLCVHDKYIEEYGMPTQADLKLHRFIALNSRPKHLVWNEWIHNNIPTGQIAILGSSQQVLTHALLAGCGIAAIPKSTVDERSDLIEISQDEGWNISAWLLVHRDMKNMPKIRKFVDVLLGNDDKPIQLI